MNIFEIKQKLNKEGRFAFQVRGRNSALFIESLLFDNGFSWRGRRSNNSLFGSWNDNDRRFNEIWVCINYQFNEPKRLSYSNNESGLDIETFNTFNYSKEQLKSIFINEPSYKPKKIKREI
jgi:hypothetical protein